ncbi:alpha/beta hydrolase [Devosia nitrariae]|uniref:Phospholipase/carboxylesterase n=1 Tax=Devosia nitrariae TaxID=2071872 RepID=A0ABQ5WAK0_9HYPH|nr:alpha/beta hydrolase [Devosia nitrariae]GLQ57096.1 phospholipase/carboxylesterase [Devosia nitrariae]
MSDYLFRESKGADAQAPVFFVFHGTGGDENQFFDLAGKLLAGAHVIAPRGDVSEAGALRYFRRTGEGVYDMDDLALRTSNMAEFARERLEGVSPSAVIGLGYSNGANILASVLFEHPEIFDAAVLMHPLIPFAPPPRPELVGKRLLITAGRRDPIGPAAATQDLADYFSGQGAAVDLFWHDGGHELRQEEFLKTAEFLKPYRVATA